MDFLWKRNRAEKPGSLSLWRSPLRPASGLRVDGIEVGALDGLISPRLLADVVEQPERLPVMAGRIGRATAQAKSRAQQVA